MKPLPLFALASLLCVAGNDADMVGWGLLGLSAMWLLLESEAG